MPLAEQILDVAQQRRVRLNAEAAAGQDNGPVVPRRRKLHVNRHAAGMGGQDVAQLLERFVLEGLFVQPDTDRRSQFLAGLVDRIDR